MLLLLRPPALAGAVMRPGTEAVTFPSEEEGIGTQKLQLMDPLLGTLSCTGDREVPPAQSKFTVLASPEPREFPAKFRVSPGKFTHWEFGF